MKYKIIDDLTSDVMFEAYGKGLKELFENAAEAMFSIICKVDKVEKKKPIKVKVDADGVEDLMIKWLQELIAVVDTEEMFLSKFNIKNIDEKHLEAECFGEEISPEKGETVVKAVTYYNFNLEKTKDGYKACVTLDI